MRRQTSRNGLTVPTGGRLAGVVSLLLVVCLITSGVTPAVNASSPPTMPHQFYGTVTFDSEPVSEGTWLEAFVDGVMQAETTVDAEGRYGYDPVFKVPGTGGAEVTFAVGGVLAAETATWQSGKAEELNLTVDGEPAPPVPTYALTMVVAPEGCGNATDETAKSPYLEGAVVDISAYAEEGYRFANWTSDPEGIVDNEDATETFVTMPGEEATVTANFERIPTSELAISSEAGGSIVAIIGQEQTVIEAGATVTIFDIAEGTEVDLAAISASGYRFVDWEATLGELDNAGAVETTFTMPDEDAAVRANFVEAHEFTMTADPYVGGMVIDVTNAPPYPEGTQISIAAEPAPGYRFVNWSATGGVFAGAEEPETTFTMPGEAVNVTAHFVEAYHHLTMAAAPDTGGAATDVMGDPPYAEGTEVSIKAEAAQGYQFVYWTSNPEGLVDDEEAEETFLIMPGANATVTANFALTYELTMIEDPVGSGEAIDVDGRGAYPVGAQVTIRAESETGFGFVNWTAEPEVTFGDATALETTFTMPDQPITVVANFSAGHAVTMAVEPGYAGAALDVGGKGAYAQGVLVTILAVPGAGYGFVNWTADTAVTFSDDTAEETTFMMPDQPVTVTANFQRVYTLHLVEEPSDGGDAMDVGDKGTYPAGATVTIRAVASTDYQFINWSAPPAVTLADPAAEETTFSMPAEPVTIIANFESPVWAPTVTTEAATGITTYSANLNMIYTLGDDSAVEVRFAARRPTDPSWFHTPWTARDADGTYAYPLTGLVAQTEYHFKAQVKYNDTVTEGAVLQFATAQQPSAGLGLDLSGLGCFIATAAYGTPAAEQINILRGFRDEVLVESALGSQFVALYYRLSPAAADYIAESDFLSAVVREILVDPVVWIVQATEDIWRQP